MKKGIRKLIAIVGIEGIILGMIGCGNANKSLEDNSTIDKETLIVGIDDAFAPMGFRDDSGKIVGFDVDLAKEVIERLGKEVEFQPIDWSMKETELNSNNIDFIWNGYTITEDRKEKVDFSDPYLNNRQVIVILADSNIKSKSDLKGKKVGAQNESSAVVAMEKEAELYASFDGGKAVTYEDNNQALMDLEAGRIDAVVADEILVRYYIKLKGEDKFNVLDDDYGNEEYGIGIRKGDSKTVQAINNALNEMKEDGTMKEISEKWFGEDITD